MTYNIIYILLKDINLRLLGSYIKHKNIINYNNIKQ